MIQFRTTTGKIQKAKADALLLWANSMGDKAGPLRGIDPKSAEAKEIAAALAAIRFKGKAGQVVQVTGKRTGRPVFVAGLGPEDKTSLEELRRGAGGGVGRARDAGAHTVAVALPGVQGPREEARAIAEGFALGAYRFTEYKTAKEVSQPDVLRTVLLVAPDRAVERDAGNGAGRGALVAEAVNLARDWANRPAAAKTPRTLAEAAKALAKGPVTCTVFDEKEIRKRAMGGLLGVAAGSVEPPRFFHLRYRPRGKPVRKIAVVGKGITFDSGGLSLKDPANMQDMKIDMSGAAAVLGLFSILPRLDLPLEVHGIVPATENLPSGSATKPGDILKSYKGKTIEVLNTDAEGRLILADALAYAEEQGVDEIVDLATLTGACMVALGTATGIFGRPQEFVDRLLEAARKAGDRSWQLPLFDDYREWIQSQVSDIKNTAGRWGGAITAALFLEEFVSSRVAWAHLDIAGSAWNEKDAPYLKAGATGTGVRTLVTYLEGLAGA